MLLEEKLKYVKFLSYLWTLIFCACVPIHLKYELLGYDLHRKVYITAHIGAPIRLLLTCLQSLLNLLSQLVTKT